MEVLFALAGIVVGWALALGTQLWTERRNARRAARFVVVEFMNNASSLKGARETPLSNWPEAWAFRHEAWASHGSSLLALLDEEETQQLQLVLHELNNVQRVLDHIWNALADSKSRCDTDRDRLLLELRESTLDAAAGGTSADREALDRRSDAIKAYLSDAKSLLEDTSKNLEKTRIEYCNKLDEVLLHLDEATRMLWPKAYRRAR